MKLIHTEAGRAWMLRANDSSTAVKMIPCEQVAPRWTAQRGVDLGNTVAHDESVIDIVLFCLTIMNTAAHICLYRQTFDMRRTLEGTLEIVDHWNVAATSPSALLQLHLHSWLNT